MNRITTTLARGLVGIALGTAALAALGSPAAAAPAAASDLRCHTGTAGSFPSYYGWGSCTGTGNWKLRVSCTAGFTYDSPIVFNFMDTQIKSYGSCNWGVSSVSVVRV